MQWTLDQRAGAPPPEGPPSGYLVLYGGPPAACAGPEPLRLEAPKTPEGLPKLAYTVKEAAAVLGLSRPVVSQLINQEAFPAWKMGGKWLISVEGLAEWVRAQAGGGAL